MKVSGPAALDLQELIDQLAAIAADRRLLDGLSNGDRERLLRAVADIYSPSRVERRRLSKRVERRRKAARVQQDEAVRSGTGIRALRKRPIHTPNYLPPLDADPLPAVADTLREAVERQPCYVCKEKYTQIHYFYDQLCPSCAELNFGKRTEVADLRGRVALVTGGRVKIGYQAGLKLLRSGAELIVTTRFPRDSAARYARELDFAEWSNRLMIYGVDLRHVPSVEALCHHLLTTRARLDFIINNACQTVRRPPEFYAHMMSGETQALDGLPSEVRGRLGDYQPGAAGSSQVPLVSEDLAIRDELFPAGQLDADLQQIDLRGRNSWRLLLDEVSTVELLEVQLVNAVAPFILNARLKPLMLRVPSRDKHIVNVSAMEGQFYRRFKTTRHPHTNMAKAALNMMTRTSATDYFADGIHMNSVDTGWITDEDPVEIAARKAAEQRFSPPLDSIDGAARILDPIIAGFNSGVHVWGQFLKDFRSTDW